MNLGHLVIGHSPDAPFQSNSHSSALQGPSQTLLWTHIPFPKGSTIYKYYGRTKNQVASPCTTCCTTSDDTQGLYLTEQEALYLVQAGCLSLTREEKQRLIGCIKDWSSFFVYSLLRNESYIPRPALIDREWHDRRPSIATTTCFDVWLPNTHYKKSSLVPDFKLFLVDPYTHPSPHSNSSSSSSSETETGSDSLVLSFVTSLLPESSRDQWIVCCLKDTFTDYSFISLTVKNKNEASL